MPLSAPTLKEAIKAAMIAQRTAADADAAADDFAGQLASAIEGFVKSLQITYTAGLAAPPGGGPVTGMFEYTLS